MNRELDNTTEVSQRLGKYSFDSIATAIGGMLLNPKHTENGYRLELLAYISAYAAKGKRPYKIASLTDLLNNRLDYFWKGQEDPQEDVFVDNLITEEGNLYFLSGLLTSATYYVQNIIDIFRSTPQKYDSAKKSIYALLSLLDASIRRANLDLYTTGESNCKKDIVTTPREILEWSKHVTFSKKDLTQLGITVEELSPFIVSKEELSDIYDSEFMESVINEKPIISSKGKLVLFLPTVLFHSIRRYVIKMFAAEDELHVFTHNLKMVQFKSITSLVSCLNEHVIELDFVKRELGLLGNIHDRFYANSEGDYYHFIQYFPSDEVFTSINYNEGIDGKEIGQKFIAYIEQCAKFTSNFPDFKKGISIIFFGGLGESLAIGWDEKFDLWDIMHVNIGDLELMMHDAIDFLPSLFGIARQREELHKRNVTFSYLDTDALLYAFWRDHEYSLYAPLGQFNTMQNSMISIQSDYLLNFRKGLKTKIRHRCYYNSRFHKYLRLKNHQQNPYFSQSNVAQNSVSYDLVKRKIILSLTSSSKVQVWVEVAPFEGDNIQFDFAYRLWEMICNWLMILLPYVDLHLPEPIDLSLILKFPVFDGWDGINIDTLPECGLDEVVKTISEITYVYFDDVFVKESHSQTNSAEKTLLHKILGVAFKDHLDTETIDSIIERAFSSPYSRFVHVFPANSYRDLIASQHIPSKPITNHQWDVAWANAKVCTPEDFAKGKITKRAHANKFLSQKVDHLWNLISDILVKHSRLDIIEFCLSNIEAIAHDKTIWKRTVPALKSLHDYAEVKGVIAKERSKLDETSLATRILIEMAYCNSPEKGESPFGVAEFSDLIALIWTLYLLASHSDAVRSEYAESWITPLANGWLDLDRTFFEKVISPYITDFFDVQFADSDEDYNRIFKIAESAEKTDDLFDKKFTEGVTSEYGVDIFKGFELANLIYEYALENEQPILILSREEVHSILSPSECPQASIEKFLDKLTLPKRPSWDQDALGFKGADWWPWKFKRRWSFVSRPVLQSKDGEFIISPGHLDESLKYIFYFASCGSFDTSYFDTQSMKSWIGHIAHELGMKFEKEVESAYKNIGFKTRQGLLMTELGATKEDGEFHKSDVDVIAWNGSSNEVFIIECKRLQQAKTLSEISEQLNKFKGVAEGEGKDLLGKHIERFEWLNKKRDKLAEKVGIKASDMKLTPLVVTNTIVPMQFISSTNHDASMFVSFNQIGQRHKG
ncbi:hypothetical protein [Paucidesulfovibrio longus]|uniref:hypothetical protein n=1 Tax=Paucidesulfovibrio longus TaxID=889 RepID=UPI0003B67C62|nr:hypothetical protein [Paucidesulfovibrio longus]